MKRRQNSRGPILAWTAAALLTGAVLLWYGLGPDAGQPVLTPLEDGPRRTSSAPVDLNAATAEELDDLPGLGPALAERIVAFREENGPFAGPEDVMEVPGIGPALYEDIAPYIGAEQEGVEP